MFSPSHTLRSSSGTSPWYSRTGWLGVKHQVTYSSEPMLFKVTDTTGSGMLFRVSLVLGPVFGMNCFALLDTVEPCLLSQTVSKPTLSSFKNNHKTYAVFFHNLKTYPVFFHKQSQNLPCLLSQTISKNLPCLLSLTISKPTLSSFTNKLKTYPVFFHKQSQNLPCLLSQTISKPTLSSFTSNLKTYPVFFHKQSQNLPFLATFLTAQLLKF